MKPLTIMARMVRWALSLLGIQRELSRWLYKNNAERLEKTGTKGYQSSRSSAGV
jgi:hypothetical protein